MLTTPWSRRFRPGRFRSTTASTTPATSTRLKGWSPERSTRGSLSARSSSPLARRETPLSSTRAAGDTAVFNNAAQAWNHDFYWNSLAPEGKGGEPSFALKAAADAAFGSLDACRAALADAAVKRFGSGWAWLVAKDGKLSVESTANADTPFGTAGVKPLLVVDVWEHAYYLDWQNQRAAYAKAVVEKHLDWSAASRRFGNV